MKVSSGEYGEATEPKSDIGTAQSNSMTLGSAVTSKAESPSLSRRPFVLATVVVVVLVGAASAVIALGQSKSVTVSTSVEKFESSGNGTSFRVDVRNTSKVSATESCEVSINLRHLPRSVTSELPDGGGSVLQIANFQTSQIRVHRTFSYNYFLPIEYESWITKKTLSVTCHNVSNGSVHNKISNSIVTSLGGGDSGAESAVTNAMVDKGLIKRSQIKSVNLGLTLNKDWLTYAVVNTLTDTGSGVLHWTGSKWIIATGPGTYQTNCPLPANIEKTVFDAPSCPT
jgi:hypothetical protein